MPSTLAGDLLNVLGRSSGTRALSNNLGIDHVASLATILAHYSPILGGDLRRARPLLKFVKSVFKVPQAYARRFLTLDVGWKTIRGIRRVFLKLKRKRDLLQRHMPEVYLEYHQNVCKVCGEALRRISRLRNVRAATHAGLRHGVIVRKRCTDCRAVHEFDHVKYENEDGKVREYFPARELSKHNRVRYRHTISCAWHISQYAQQTVPYATHVSNTHKTRFL